MVKDDMKFIKYSHFFIIRKKLNIQIQITKLSRLFGYGLGGDGWVDNLT